MANAAPNKIAVTLDEDHMKFLRKQSKAEGTPVSALIRTIVERSVSKQMANAKTRRAIV